MMKTIDFLSARFSLAITIIFMGMLGLFFALLTGEWYKTLVLENEQNSLRSLLAYEVSEDLEDNAKKAIKLAQILHKTKDFKVALKAFDKLSLTKIFNNQFHQYYVTTARIDLISLSLLDLKFKELVRSTEHSSGGFNYKICQTALRKVSQRKGTARLKIFSDLCVDENYALQAVIIPVGGLRPTGYLLVLTNPVASIMGISEELNTPVEVTLANGKLLDSIGKWPEKDEQTDRNKIQYISRDMDNTPVLIVTIYKENRNLYQALNSVRLKVLLIVCLITVLAIMMAFLVLESSLLLPLKKLSRHLQRIQVDRRHLGEHFEVMGNSEIRQLAENFNNMSSELKALYSQLEDMAFSDPLTQLPNRAWFYEDLKRLSNASARNLRGFSLLFLDLNKFKPINDQHGHQVGDKVLKEVTLRISGVLRGSDYLARVSGEQGSTEHYESLSRMGGDEFAVLLPGVVKYEDAVSVAEKIIASVVAPIIMDELSLKVGVSIGIAFYPQDNNDIGKLIHYADLAMYHAKNKNMGYACFNRTMLNS